MYRSNTSRSLVIKLNRSYCYRLYPNKQQEELLKQMLSAYRELWNAALEERKEAWQRNRISISCYDQCNQLKDIRRDCPDFGKWNNNAAQRVLRRLDKAFVAFFQRIKNGEKPGYPRFRSASRFKSVPFTFGNGAHIRDGRLYIQAIGNVKVKWHRGIPEDAKIKMVVLKHDSDGHWYATFQLELPDAEVPIKIGPEVGIDVGLTSFVALSNGEIVDSPKYFREAQKKLKRQQRRLNRRRKGSRRRKKARLLVAQTHSHIANQRADFAHKLSRDLVDRFALIAVEDLNIKGLAAGMLAKSVHDAGWSQFLSFIDYKAAEAGCQFVKVDPRNTSQVCSGCGCVVRKDLSVRVHSCPHCGLFLDRDVNAARNILSRALGRSVQALTYPVGESVA